jgi:hypothetical protein
LGIKSINVTTGAQGVPKVTIEIWPYTLTPNMWNKRHNKNAILLYLKSIRMVMFIWHKYIKNI